MACTRGRKLPTKGTQHRSQAAKHAATIMAEASSKQPRSFMEPHPQHSLTQLAQPQAYYQARSRNTPAQINRWQHDKLCGQGTDYTDARSVQLLAVCLLKALQAQNEMTGPAAVMIAAAILNIGLNKLLIRRFGFIGAPVATTASRFAMLAMALAHVLASRAARPRAARRGGGAAAGAAAAPALELELPMLKGSGSGFDGLGGGAPDAAKVARRGASAEHSDAAALEWPEVRAACARGITLPYLASFARLGGAGGVMVAFEASSFDVTTAFAAQLGAVAVRALTEFC